MLDAALAPQVFDPIAARDALAGLRATPKTLPSRLFYDDEGVRLFEQITTLPEYYLTRTETALLRSIAPQIVALAPKGAALVEYGASDDAKAQLLLRAPGAPFAAYAPIDVAAGALAALKLRMAGTTPGIAVHPVHGDFLRSLALPPAVQARPRFGFFPGSTIGNLEPAVAVAFLLAARATLGAGAWLIVGADLRKDPAILLPAYDDAQGVTAAFNLNILHHVNRVAGGEFDAESFRHRAIWNDAESRIEMHLESRVAQTVRLGSETIRFAAGETIHTENSYKHALPAFQALAREAGWRPLRAWSDPARLFAVHALFNIG